MNNTGSEGEETGELVIVDPDPEPRTVHGTVTGWAVADRQPVIPAWMRSRADARQLAGWLARYGAHAALYHLTRLPLYALRLVLRVPRGLGVAVLRAARWVFDSEGAPLRVASVARGSVEDYLKLTKVRNSRTRQRAPVAAAAVVALAVAGTAVGVWAPGWVQLLALAAVVVVFGKLGTPQDRRVTNPATVNTSAPPRLTAEVVSRALRSLGLAGLNEKTGEISYVAPITRDGPGWRADLDLPHGITVTDVIERRDRLASGLRRPLGCCWPEAPTEQHAGRLVLFVADVPLSQARPAVWPLRKSGTADVFGVLPFGVDQRQRPVGLPLIESNLLIGSLPGAGKTAALRVGLLGCALDPTVELHIFELKGSGDLESLERVAHAYGSGVDDGTIGECLAGLRRLLAELERRAETLKQLRSTARDLVPDSKVTRELANRRSMGLFPVVFGIDECQELFSHPQFGKEAGELATAIIKRGRALGVMLILATQRPDKDSLPTGISANVGIRYCLRVMGQTENDMILGTSMYKNGVRASMLTRSDRGVGYLVGATDAPTVVKSYYLNAEDSDAVISRAYTARQAAGLLTGAAVGETPEREPAWDLLDDVRTVLTATGAEQIWHSELLAALVELRPTIYTGWTVTRLGKELRDRGVRTVQVGATLEDGTRGNRNGVRLDDLTRAVAAAAERRELGP